MADDSIFNRGMALLMAAYPDYDCSPATMDIYREFLSHLSNLDFERAVKTHISKCKWFPKVSELLDVIRAQRSTAIDAWNFLLKAAETGVKPEMDGPTAAALEAAGGWHYFSFTPYEQLHYIFKKFQEAYDRGLDRQEIGQAAIEHQPKGLLEG